ncbi:hypothetical protein KZC52_11610 [Microbacterium sp. kSW2-24]|uniref:hypothetical protein n=1 Tax=Microbacterium galbinum TaxID=2851646 RepID=UPI001FFD7736|nr:hypothetical protein [Microbacterium galbinum]MCK2023574.1 hypothetical protein [Microbacterium galbinum]
MRRVLVGLLAGGALLLTGCGMNQSAADEVVPGLPDDWSGPQPHLIAAEPVAGWVDGEESFGIVTFGSSSCPLVAASVSADDPGTVTVDFRYSSNNPCTADMAMTTHVFTLPENVTQRPVAVAFVLDGTTVRMELPG